MGATDATETLDQAIAISHGFFVMYYGPAYLSGELREYLGDPGMGHT